MKEKYMIEIVVSIIFRWMVHENPPGKDYYNWTGRCLSAGTPYNPHKVIIAKLIIFKEILQITNNQEYKYLLGRLGSKSYGILFNS